ncbi:MAG: glycosyltransferase family 2 protein [Enhydrobacter sp.]|nr:glycosyltransferase family 2 protein [Enhydrobacter sp.]
MASEHLLASRHVPFNSEFVRWTSASLTNPANVTYFCENWFVTAPRGPRVDFVLQPLKAKPGSGLRVLVREPPEMLRIWHKLPAGFFDSGKKVVRFKVRGKRAQTQPLQLDSVALFRGSDVDRRFVKTFLGPMPLERSWRKVIVELAAEPANSEDARFISFRFSGIGVIEFAHCRLGTADPGARAWAVTRGLATRVMSKFRPGVPGRMGRSIGMQDGPTYRNGIKPDPVVAPPGVHAVDKPGAAFGPSALTGTAGSLLQNANFEHWSASGLEHWKLGGGKGVTLVPGATALDRPSKNDGVTLGMKGSMPGQPASLSQPFRDLGSDQPLDVILVGCADSRTEIEIVLRQSRSDGSGDEVRTRLTLGQRWQFRTARLRTPPSWHHDSISELSLVVCEEKSGYVHLALLAAGPPGLDVSRQLELREIPTTASNAIANGSFEYWTGSLARRLSERQVPITEEWAAVSPTPNPGVEVRLTEIAPRGLRDGADHAPVLGLAVQGDLAGPYLRVQTTLDILSILAAPARKLSFVARTAHASKGTGVTPRRGLIKEVFIAERRRASAGSNEVTTVRLFTVARNVGVGRIGERFTFELRGDHRAQLTAKAKKVVHDSVRSLLLIFECTALADFAIADVTLGGDASTGEARSTSSKAISFEDPNIEAQLAQLKGLDHWRRQHALRAVKWQPASIHAEEAKWIWPARFTSIDIVVCVHNAVDETLNCLDALRRCTTVPHTVLIVDDRSNHTTREQLRRYIHGKPWMRLVENEKNLGYTRSANIGLSSSSAEWVVLLNSDAIVTPGWLEGMFEAVNSRPGVALVGPVSNAASWQSVPEIHDVKGGWSTNPLPDGWSIDQMAEAVRELSLRMFPEATLLNGFCTLMRRDVIEEVGFLDEDSFPMGYGEENDLCLRVRKAGYTLAIADHVYVYHIKSASFGKGRRAELSKQGTAQLHAKHPDVDMKLVQRELAESGALIELRRRLRKHLDRRGPGGVDLEAIPLADTAASLLVTSDLNADAEGMTSA